MNRKTLALTLSSALLLAACSSAGPTATPQPSATATLPPTSAPASTPSASVSTSLQLEVTSPADESVVQVSPIEVRGKTAPDAVVSINGVVVEPNADGVFQALVPLQPGPNAIDIVASDFQGNQKGLVLSVVYSS